MSKFAFFTVVLAFLSVSMSAQDVDITSNLEIHARAMIKAIVVQDYDSYVKYSYPPMVKMYGGKEAIIEVTRSNRASQKDVGMVIKTAAFNSSLAPVSSDSTLQSIVSFDYAMEIGGNNYKGIHYLLALSTNEGIDWTFVELETFDEISIKDFVPLYSEELPFPDIKGAVYIEEK